jgi:hypothetical protein
MKRTIFVLLILIAALTLTSEGFNHLRRVQAVNVQINIKDLPEHNLKLTGPSDPSFNGRVTAMLKGKPNPLVEALKPFSVFLKNTGNKTVVAYYIKWEKVRADGTVVTSGITGINPTPLMDGGKPGLEYLSNSSGQAIKPNAAKFISTVFALDEEETSSESIFGLMGGSPDQGAIDQLQQTGQPDEQAMLNILTTELQSYSNITISIDGVFFEDGTFVGPNSTQFFEKVQANVNAKRDLLEEIAFDMQRHRNIEEIFSEVEQLANSPDDLKNPVVTPTEHYNYYKKIYAKEILQMRKALTDKPAILTALEPLRRSWKTLKKQ